MRSFAIWVSGILAAGTFGALAGAAFMGDARSDREGGMFVGFIAGVLAFTCFRLWLGGRREE